MTRTPTLVLAAVLVVALAGCVPAKGVDVAPTRTASVAFASDEEALAAAVEAYSGYQSAYAALAADPTLDLDRLSDWAIDPYLQAAREDLSLMAERGWHRVGRSTFSSAELVGRTEITVHIRICDDISEVKIIDSTGTNVSPLDRKDSASLLVEFAVVDHKLFLANRVLEAVNC